MMSLLSANECDTLDQPLHSVMKSCKYGSKPQRRSIINLFKRFVSIQLMLTVLMVPIGLDAFMFGKGAPFSTTPNPRHFSNHVKVNSIMPHYHGEGRLPTIQMQAKKQHEDEERDKVLALLMSNWIQDVNILEVRLDATLASCYGLCRFLILDITTGAKDVPGWQLSDFIMLGGAFSSCIVLASIWCLIGIALGIFEFDTEGSNSLKIILNALIAGPIWILLEVAFGWPPGGVIAANDFKSVLDTMGLASLVATGTIGLASIMCFGRISTSRWM